MDDLGMPPRHAKPMDVYRDVLSPGEIVIDCVRNRPCGCVESKYCIS